MHYKLKIGLICVSLYSTFLVGSSSLCCSSLEEPEKRQLTLRETHKKELQAATELRQSAVEEEIIPIPTAAIIKRHAHSVTLSIPLVDGNILRAEIAVSSTGIATSSIHVSSKRAPFSLSTFLAVYHCMPAVAPHGERVKQFFRDYGLTFKFDPFQARAHEGLVIADKDLE
jgi:hypothetical protein